METREASNGCINTLERDSFGLMNGILHLAGKYVSNEWMRF